MLRNATCSATFFHCRRTAGVYAFSSLSTTLEQFWQSQMPLLIEVRSTCDMFVSKRGPPTAAAAMCAATPTLIALSGSEWGPLVVSWHDGLEHRIPTLRANVSFVLPL